MENKKSYYSIIPANVRYDKDLTPNAKLLYSEITALCNEKGYCWANNSYFAELYQVSNTSISKWISQLRKKGYIGIELIYKKGTKQIENRYITLVKYPMEEKLGGYITNVKDPIKEKLKDNNTTNNTINTKDERETSKIGYLDLMSSEEKIELSKKYNCTLNDISHKVESLKLYCESNGKKYKNYKSALQNWLLRDFGLRKENYLKFKK